MRLTIGALEEMVKSRRAPESFDSSGKPPGFVAVTEGRTRPVRDMATVTRLARGGGTRHGPAWHVAQWLLICGKC